MDLLVSGDGVARFGAHTVRCALGRGGLSADKREGDGATPIGAWPLRRLLYRPDRLEPPPTGLPVTPIAATDGWCDAPGDPNYNLPVVLPYPASTEALWREDTVYDLIVPLGYNDTPVVSGRGSAIFLHLARDGYLPTEGCVALARADLLAYLTVATPHSRVVVTP
ncbi:hypothetical protein GCM10011611_43200 [Aliidongia dinghuensis]|uniref:L,D-TPase catalytic domain-containing protein n=1 Tax=Aliidongia dinghuensis TaxID=1867774 RepID=A0A8J3E3Q5_9PROT|nr:hypothetical protein GCM10011611_43200 [Aliidongia dinghuensis]